MSVTTVFSKGTQDERIMLVLEGLIEGHCTLTPYGATAIMRTTAGTECVLLQEDFEKMLAAGLIAFNGPKS